MEINLASLKDYFGCWRIVYIIGDDSMNNIFEKEYSSDPVVEIYSKCLEKYNTGIEYYEGKPVYYFIVREFYSFLLKELNRLESYIMKKCAEVNNEYLLARIKSFKDKFDFDAFYEKNLETLLMVLNEYSMEKLSKIIRLMKKEYNIYYKMKMDYDILNEMIDWIEDSLFILKKYIEKLASSQEITYEETIYINNEKNNRSDYPNIPYAA